MTPFLTRVQLAVFLSALLHAGSAAAQSTPRDIFVGWAPAFVDPEYRILPAWALSVAGGGRVAPVFDVGGWYFCCDQSIHNLLGGVRFRPADSDGPRPFAQVLAGTSIFHAYGTAGGWAFVPGGGVDVPIPGHALAIRVQGDYVGVYAPGDYGRYYCDHVWRISTGVVFPF